jgi:hypothetical protein
MGVSVWNVFHISVLLVIILRWVLDFWKICETLHIRIFYFNYSVCCIFKMEDGQPITIHFRCLIVYCGKSFGLNQKQS